MSIYLEGSYVWLSFGHNDKNAMMAKLNLHELLDSLDNVTASATATFTAEGSTGAWSSQGGTAVTRRSLLRSSRKYARRHLID